MFRSYSDPNVVAEGDAKSHEKGNRVKRVLEEKKRSNCKTKMNQKSYSWNQKKLNEVRNWEVQKEKNYSTIKR